MLLVKRVDKDHVLMLKASNDVVYLINQHDQSNTAILSFNSNGQCVDQDQVIVARIKVKSDYHWHIETELSIDVPPVSLLVDQSIFEIEKLFCQQYLQLLALDEQ